MKSVKADSQGTSKQAFRSSIEIEIARCSSFRPRVRRAMHSRSKRGRVNCLMKELREIDASGEWMPDCSTRGEKVHERCTKNRVKLFRC